MSTDLLVSDVLDEASNLYNEINAETENTKNIDTALDLVEEIGSSVDGITTESMSSENLKLVVLTMESILGVDVLKELHLDLKLEDGANRSETRIISESIKGLVRDFWQALKNSFNAVWAKLKTWYITVTSAAESLIRKANKLRSSAENISSTPDTKKFDFKDYRGIHIGGKVDSGPLRKGLETINKVVESILNVRTANETEKFIEAASDAVEGFIKNESMAQPDNSWVKRFSNLYTPSVGVTLTTVTNADIKNQIIFDDANADYKQTDPLPGNRSLVFSEIKVDSTLELADQISLIAGRLVRTDKKEYNQQTVSVNTLHPAQIVDICDNVIQLCEHVTFYEKAWQKRDKFMSQILKNLDRAIERINQEELGEGKDVKFKKTTRAIINAIKRSNTFNAAVLNIVLATSAGSLNYCAASLAMYK